MSNRPMAHGVAVLLKPQARFRNKFLSNGMLQHKIL